MTMQSRHFELIAEAIYSSKPATHWDLNKHAQYEVTVTRMADALSRTNPNFNRAKFLAACGVED